MDLDKQMILKLKQEINWSGTSDSARVNHTKYTKHNENQENQNPTLMKYVEGILELTERITSGQC